MRLIFLGTASAFVTDVDNFQSNMLLQSADGQLLLIDCGTDARRSLHVLGYSYRDISNVYVSHLHADHVGGLEWLAFSRKFDSQHLAKPNLYICEKMVKALWDHTLSGGLTSLTDEPSSLAAYFQVHPIGVNKSFIWESIKFQIIENQHISTEYAEMPSYGLFFLANHQQVFLTTDTQFRPETMQSYYEKADIIFQDCETAKNLSGVHAHYQQLKTLDAKIKAKMWLYHYNNEQLPDAQADGFAGFAKPGQTFDF